MAGQGGVEQAGNRVGGGGFAAGTRRRLGAGTLRGSPLLPAHGVFSMA
jgi:hypothetical protein